MTSGGTVSFAITNDVVLEEDARGRRYYKNVARGHQLANLGHRQRFPKKQGVTYRLVLEGTL